MELLCESYPILLKILFGDLIKFRSFNFMGTSNRFRNRFLLVLNLAHFVLDEMCESSRSNNEKLINELFASQISADVEKTPLQSFEPTTDTNFANEKTSATKDVTSDYDASNEIPPFAGLGDPSHSKDDESLAEEESKDTFLLAEIDEEEMKLKEETMSPLELDEK